MISATAAHPSWKITPRVLADLVAIVGADNVLHNRDETLVYECDGYMVEKSLPDVVVFPTSTQHVVEVVKLCNRHDIPFVPRGAGTSLAGGTLTIGGGLMICLTRMKRILEVSVRDRYAIVESGVVNVWLTRSLAGTGFHYAPDPSSQGACTIGGNVATNSGGPHTLKYGVTVNHIKGTTLVMPDGYGRRDRRDHRRQSRLRPDGAGRGQRGDLWHRHPGGREPDARPRGGPDAAGGLRLGRRRDRDRERDHRGGDRAGRPRDARQPDDPGGREGVRLRLSDRGGGRA